MTRFTALNSTELVFVVEAAFDVDECGALVERIEREQPRLTTDNTARETVRHNSRVVVFDQDLANVTWGRVRHRVPQTLVGLTPVGANECIRFYGYTVGDFFKPHQDTDFMRSRLERSLLSIVVYLNSDYDGGELVLRDRRESIKPKTGMAVVFGHRIVHESEPITRGKKYAFRSDVMFRQPAS